MRGPLIWRLRRPHPRNGALLLRWASWVISLPVVLFACGPFFPAPARYPPAAGDMDLPVALGMVITFVVLTALLSPPPESLDREVFFDSLTMFVFFC